MRHIPNLMTLLNLFCGCLAVVSLFHGRVDHAAALVVLAAVLDFFDGFVARLLHAGSEFGKQLDSLADMVTFGLVPGMVLYNLMLKSNFFVLFESHQLFSVFKYSMFLVTVFSALRLARFNIDEKQKSYFIGVPTPLNTLWIISLPLILLYDRFGLRPYILNPLVLMGLAMISSYLLVAEIPMLSLKFESFGWKKNKNRWILLFGSVLLLLVLQFAAAPLIMIFYVILSLIFPPDKKQTV